MRLSDKFESFIEAFGSNGGGCRKDCDCGTQWYDYLGHWDWAEGEMEQLEKSGAKALEYSVCSVIFEGREFVIDCECWRARAEKIMKWMDAYAPQIAKYLTNEKKRKTSEAARSPVVE